LSSPPYNLGVFPAKRRKIREVDVEVVEPRRDGAIAPVNSTSEALNSGDVADSSAERPPTTHGDPFLSSLLAVALQRIRGENVMEPHTAESVADLAEHTEEPVDKPRADRWRRRAREVTQVQASATAPDAGAERLERVEEPPAAPQERPRPKLMRVLAGEPMLVETPEPVEADADNPVNTKVRPVEEAIRESPAPEPTADTDVGTPEPEEPRSTAPPPFKEATEEQPAPSPTSRPKSRVVWRSSPAPSAQRAHTLKLTKTAPTETRRQAGANRAPVEQPPVEKPRAAQSPPPEAAIPQAAASGIAPDVPAKSREAADDFRSAEPAPIDEGLREEPPAPLPPPSEQTCDIVFWRGYRKAAFFGRTFDETGEAVAVAESPFFRPQGNGAPDPTEAAKAAYEALRSQLIAGGWEPVAAGDDWFDETFRLTAAAEPEPE
jgi:hypothetical protein